MRPISPCLLALYAERSATPCNPATDATLTTEPDPFAIISRPNALAKRNGATKLTSITFRYSSADVSNAELMHEIPALFTNASTRPNLSMQCFAAASTNCSSEMSPASAKADVYSDVSTDCKSSKKRFQPCSLSTCAVRRPIPCAAPVITAT